MNDLELIQSFKNNYGIELYRQIENESKVYHNPVRLIKNPKYLGLVICLWLPNNLLKNRPNDLWFVRWFKNGFNTFNPNESNYGICEEKDLEVISWSEVNSLNAEM